MSVPPFREDVEACFVFRFSAVDDIEGLLGGKDPGGFLRGHVWRCLRCFCDVFAMRGCRGEGDVHDEVMARNNRQDNM